jgi:hypothetical protein
MSGYIGSTPVPQATQHRESFTCTEGQTSFATAGYTAQFVDVYLNGSHLSPADFTATNGSDVVLGVAASADDVCDIISYTPFEIADQTFTGNTIMTNGDNTAQLTLKSTDADALVGPVLDLYRNSASPADNDLLGEISFRGRNDNSQDVDFATIFSTVIDASDGTEDGEISFKTMKAGTLTETLVMQSGSVGIGVNTPGAPLHIEAADNANLLRFTVSGQEDWAFKGASAVGSNDTISFGIFNGTQAMTWDENGICTMPAQPAFSARPTDTQANIIDGDTKIKFSTQMFDTNDDFQPSTGDGQGGDGSNLVATFTAPVTGKYQLNMSLRMENIDSAVTYYQIQLITSNRNYRYIFDPDFGQDNAFFTPSMSVLADMDASDTAFIFITQAGGTAQTDIHSESAFNGYLVA